MITNVLAEVVRDEIEENLLIHAHRLPAPEADNFIRATTAG